MYNIFCIFRFYISLIRSKRVITSQTQKTKNVIKEDVADTLPKYQKSRKSKNLRNIIANIYGRFLF